MVEVFLSRTPRLGKAPILGGMRVLFLVVALSLAACAPFQSGGLFNPIRTATGQTTVLPAAGSTFLEYSVSLGVGFAPDLVPAYLSQNDLSLGIRRSTPSQKVDYTLRPIIIPEGWNVGVSQVVVRAEVERSLEQTGFNELTRSVRLGRSSATALLQLSSPAAQTQPFSLGLTFEAEGSSFSIQLGVRPIVGLVVSSPESPIRVGNGDQVSIPTDSKVWLEVSLGEATAAYLATRRFRPLTGDSSSSLNIPLRNVSLRLEESPQGLNWNVWNCNARGSLRESLRQSLQIIQLNPSGVTCFSEVGLAEGWQPGVVRGQIVSSELVAPINFFVQKGQ